MKADNDINDGDNNDDGDDSHELSLSLSLSLPLSRFFFSCIITFIKIYELLLISIANHKLI